jgi:hypothetical protein
LNVLRTQKPRRSGAFVASYGKTIQAKTGWRVAGFDKVITANEALKHPPSRFCNDSLWGLLLILFVVPHRQTEVEC